jgi:2-oxo-4-hydroxy-4-carboxy-5-ureidoimidazoline decarboxylase
VTLAELNALDGDAAASALRRCCGSTRWARQMAAVRPFASRDAMTAQADGIWSALGPADWLEAFAAHPKIGESGTAGRAGGADRAGGAGGAGGEGRWSDEEQQGVARAAEPILTRLAQANHEYEARFGYIFIVCATGKGAAEILGLIAQRLTNDPAAELAAAAEEQRKITRLRLARLLMENG